MKPLSVALAVVLALLPAGPAAGAVLKTVPAQTGPVAPAPALGPLGGLSGPQMSPLLAPGSLDVRLAPRPTLPTPTLQGQTQVPLKEILRQSDALLWGENHFSLSALDWLAANLPQLKESGVTQLAFENLELSAEQGLRDYLEGRSDDIPEDAFFDYRREQIQSLYESARSAGMGIVALQRPYLEWYEEIVEIASRHPGIPQTLLSDPEAMMRFISQADYRRIPGLNEAVAEVAMTRRNKFMADRLKQSLAPGEKVLILAGYGHLEHPEGLEVDKIFGVPAAPLGNLGMELQSVGLRPFSIALTGGRFLDEQARDLDHELKAAAYRRLAETGSDPDSEVFLPTSGRSAIFHMGSPARVQDTFADYKETGQKSRRELILTPAAGSERSVSEDVYADLLLASGMAPAEVMAKLDTQLRQVGIPPELMREHGARLVGTVRRINALVLDAREDAALPRALEGMGFTVRIREKPSEVPSDPDQFKPVVDPAQVTSLKRLARITGADRLQAELKKVLGEPQPPSPERMRESSPLARLLAWLRKTFYSLILGVAAANPVIPWAILDTWVYADHPFLRGRFEKNVWNTPSHEDHGTHTASTVVGVDIFNFSGRSYNIAPNGSISEGKATLLLNQAVEDGALATTNSWGHWTGSPEYVPVKLFMETAAEGVHHDIAAGNLGGDMSDTLSTPGIAYYLTDLVLGRRTLPKAVKRIKTIGATDADGAATDFTGTGPGSWATAMLPADYPDYPAKPDEATVGRYVLAATIPEKGDFVPELGGPGIIHSGTSMSTPGAFGAFLLLTRACLVLLRDYLPKLQPRALTLYSMDLARHAMTATARKLSPAIKTGDGSIDVWAAFQYAAGLLKASDDRFWPRVREVLRRIAGVGGYGRARTPDSPAAPSLAVIRPLGPELDYPYPRGTPDPTDTRGVVQTHWASDGSAFIASVDGLLRRMDPKTGESLWTYEGFRGRTVLASALNADGTLLAVAVDDNSVHFIDARAGTSRRDRLRGVGAHALVFHPKDPGLLFTGGNDRAAYLIDVNTGGRLARFSGQRDRVVSLAVSSDGRHLYTGSMDGTALRWDVARQSYDRVYATPHESMNSLALSPDDKTLFTGGRHARAWDVDSDSGRPTREFRSTWAGSMFWVSRMRATRDGRFLITGHNAPALLLWETATGRLAGILRPASEPKEQLSAFDLDSAGRIITGSEVTAEILLWSLPEAPHQR
ncbi:MAG: S8 family serine peptidase [Elusimicrobiota bacterium]